MPHQIIHSLPELEALIATGQPVAIDFHAVWCGPCKAMAPQFEELSKKYPTIAFVKVDVDQAPEIAAKLGITAMPTFIFFKGGKQVASIVGANPVLLETEVKKLSA